MKLFLQIFSKPDTIKFKLNIRKKEPESNQILVEETGFQFHRSFVFKNLFVKIFCPNLLYKADFQNTSVGKIFVTDGTLKNKFVKIGKLLRFFKDLL